MMASDLESVWPAAPAAPESVSGLASAFGATTNPLVRVARRR